MHGCLPLECAYWTILQGTPTYKLPPMATQTSCGPAIAAIADVEPPWSRVWQQLSEPDLALPAQLVWVERGCLVVAGLISAAVLSAWLFPSLDSVMFSGWMLMKANTALLLLLSTLGLSLSLPRRPGWLLTIGQLLGLAVLLIAGAVLVEYAFHVSIGIDTLLAADLESPEPGRMSPQTALALSLLAVVLISIRVSERRSARVIDLFAFSLCALVMVIVSGYAFGALHLLGASTSTRTAPYTLVALVLLTLVAVGRRAERGFFSILLGAGVGSKIARIAVPFVLVLPFALEAARLQIVQSKLLSAAYSTASLTALAAVAGLAMILIFAWQIENLEQDIRTLSLRDDLTGLYNRRGFVVLAERALQLAYRAQAPLSVMFLDLDNLKGVNDTLGHDTGSEFLTEVATLLKGSFRETDIIGRIGGDEFVVAGVFTGDGMYLASQRMEQGAADRNAQPGHAYPLSFSVGHVISGAGKQESLEEMLNRADAAMYASKRSKKLARGG